MSKIVLVSIALFFLDYRIAIVTITLLTTPLYIPKLIAKRLQQAKNDHLKAVEANLTKITDWLSGFEVIKNYSLEQKIMEHFDHSNKYVAEKFSADKKLEAIAQLLTTLISYLSYFIILAVSTWLVLSGDFTAGNFFVAIGMIDQLSYPMISLSGILRMLFSIKPTCNDLQEFVKIPFSQEVARELTSLRESLVFKNVDFSYDGQRSILSNFNFVVKKNGRYLIKGTSGSGKTTAINLLLRYYDVNAGDILIDQESLENFDESFACMTVVRQDTKMFLDTLRNNLTMYNDISDKKLILLLEQLDLKQFASKEALDQMVEEDGSNLSGGEKKRLSLARALLRNTDVLLLDEPLANLDVDTVNNIENLILSITDRTMIIVSHQFSENKLSFFDEVVLLGQ